MTQALTADEVLRLPATTNLETAAAAFGIGRGTAYDLARKGEFPCRVIRAGRALRVASADIIRALGLEDRVPAASQG
ncbi:helix-turn-helix domain-containing protein [Streptomyces sp. NPDC006207]